MGDMSWEDINQSIDLENHPSTYIRAVQLRTYDDAEIVKQVTPIIWYSISDVDRVITNSGLLEGQICFVFLRLQHPTIINSWINWSNREILGAN